MKILWIMLMVVCFMIGWVFSDFIVPMDTVKSKIKEANDLLDKAEKINLKADKYFNQAKLAYNESQEMKAEAKAMLDRVGLMIKDPNPPKEIRDKLDKVMKEWKQMILKGKKKND